ncbi:MAG: sulfurtransferase-like selenium metabolism protein YedF [Lachnospiraceae bacterium]
MIRVDALGDACPVPVIKTKKALDGAGTGEVIEIHVDNEIAVQNLRKLAGSQGCSFRSERLEDKHFVVTVAAAGAPLPDEAVLQPELCHPDSRGTAVVVIRAAVMGQGDDALGKVLIKGYIYALSQLETLPAAILFYNGGVTLTTAGSDSLEDLKSMEALGVKIISCGTCLNFYQLTDQLEVGTIGNMYEIAETMQNASKVIIP